MLDADDKTISAIDQETRSPKGAPFSTTSTPTDIAAGAGALWIGNAFRELPFSSTSYPQSVSRLDPDSRVVVDTIPLPRPGVVQYNPEGGWLRPLEHIAVTSDAVWVVGADQGVYRIDPRTNKLVGRVKGIEAVGIAAGGGGVWVIEYGDAAVARIDPRTNTITQRIPVASKGLSSLAVGAQDLWAADPFDGLVWRIDPGPNRQRTIPLDVGVTWVAVGAGAVWATNELAGLVYRIDPSTNKAKIVHRTAAPATVAVGGGAAWVSAAGRPSSGTALPILDLRPAARRRGGQPAVPDRLRSPAEGLGHRCDPPDGGCDQARPRAASLPGRRIHDRLPVLRRLDRPGRVGITTFAATRTHRRMRAIPT